MTPRRSTRSNKRVPRSGRGEKKTRLSKAAEIYGRSETIFFHFSQAIAELEACGTDMQKQFTTWAKKPPLSGNQQNRFANTLERWTGSLGRVLEGFEVGMVAANALPSYSHCSPREKQAKRIAAGLKTLRADKVLRDLRDKLQSFANRACQPLTAEESNRLWNEFEQFVLRLGGVLEEMRAVRNLIKNSLRRTDVAAARAHEERVLASRSSRITSRASPPIVAAVRNGKLAENALEKIDAKVDKLRSGVARILEDLQTVAKAKRGREKLNALHHEVLQALIKFDLQVDVFRASLDDDKECKEVMAAGSSSPLFDLAVAIKDIIERMKEKSAWCMSWLEIIRRREAAAFMLPKEVPDELARIIRTLDTVSMKIRLQGGSTRRPMTGGDVHPRGLASVELVDSDIAVLRCFFRGSQDASSAYTVKELALDTGLNEQKVRRILVERLGIDGMGVVRHEKPKRGKDNKSPPHLFRLDAELVEYVREILQGR